MPTGIVQEQGRCAQLLKCCCGPMPGVSVCLSSRESLFRGARDLGVPIRAAARKARIHFETDPPKHIGAACIPQYNDLYPNFGDRVACPFFMPEQRFESDWP